MTDTVIRVENLGKQYRIGLQDKAPQSIRQVVSSFFGSPFKYLNTVLRPPTSEEIVWALKDVSFEVQRGEVIGVIGRNGAGKSTLLKILSRITEPTTGYAEIRGRVASLLEVGAGFHPELTGRENIYLNGTIMGMKKREIDRRFDEIVDFAGVEKYIDTPVKRYSSGMYVRLAFAVAAHLEPEILIVDEVLAVGDVAFQKKCLGKMQDVAATESRTVLFVSHNLGAVRSICKKAVWLANGVVAGYSNADSVIETYLERSSGDTIASGQTSWLINSAPGCDDCKLLDARLTKSSGELSSVFSPQEPINITVKYGLFSPFNGLRLGIQVLTLTGEIAFTTSNQIQQLEQCLPGYYQVMCRIPGELMNLSSYIVRFWIGVPGFKFLVEPIDILKFSISGIGNHNSTFDDYQNWPGVVCPKLQWAINSVEVA